MKSKRQSSKGRNSRKTRRGGNLTTLGQAASNFLLPAGLFWAAKKLQKGRSVSKVMRSRRY